MDKKELQRMLQQKFAQAKPSTLPAQHLQNEWRQRLEIWLNECQQTNETINSISPKVLESIQAFITNYLLEAVNKNTFQLKEGEMYQKYYQKLEALKAKIATCSNLTELTELIKEELTMVK